MLLAGTDTGIIILSLDAANNSVNGCSEECFPPPNVLCRLTENCLATSDSLGPLLWLFAHH